MDDHIEPKKTKLPPGGLRTPIDLDHVGEVMSSMRPNVRREMTVTTTRGSTSGDIEALAREHASKYVKPILDRLTAIALAPDSKVSDAIRAGTIVLDRALGRPSTTIQSETLSAEFPGNDHLEALRKKQEERRALSAQRPADDGEDD